MSDQHIQQFLEVVTVISGTTAGFCAGILYHCWRWPHGHTKEKS